MYKIAVILPKYKNDYLTDTILDGLILLQKEGMVDFRVTGSYKTDLDIKQNRISQIDFINFANHADLVLFMKGKDGIVKNYFLLKRIENNTNYDLCQTINRYEKTVYIDGSEVGGSRRYDVDILNKIINGTYIGRGSIDLEMEKKCALYFRREKPYVRNIEPLPFGIETGYLKRYKQSVIKDIDFFCVFGYEEYATLRTEVREELVKFCKENNLTYFVDKVPQDKYYEILARSKVGISVGGGGYDTARFWEILGNNCILLTEKIDIYEDNSDRLKYSRIHEFTNLEDFKLQLEKITSFLKNEYDQNTMQSEYSDILGKHTSRARVLEILEVSKKRGII